MKPRHNFANKKGFPVKKQPTQSKEAQSVDDLGVIRGQNGEKGDTVRPENIIRRNRAEH
ncbi:MAG: hypothetical protein JWM68_423 [Verrucomicrobiales bacterium]|nr:hypothetical protein [Verrucomicrobiales bacterium]